MFRAIIFIIILVTGNNSYPQNKTKNTNLKDTYLKTGKQFLNVNPDSSIYFYKKALAICKKENDSINTAIIYNKLGINYFRLGKLDTAIYYYKKLKKRKELNNDIKGVGIAYNNIGNAYFVLGKYLDAEKYQLLALKIFKKIKYENGIASCYLNLSLIYENLSESNYFTDVNYDISIDYLKKALKKYKTIGNNKGIANVYTNLGNIYANKNELDNAYDYYIKEKELRISTNDKYGEAGCYNNIGLIEHKRGNFSKALEMASKSMQINTEINNKQGICKSLYLNGLCFEGIEKTKKAIEYFNNSYNIAHKNSFVDMQKVTAKKLSELYEKVGNIDNAFVFHKKYIAINDSITTDKASKLITEIQTKYETEKKQIQIEKQAKALEFEKVKNKNKSLKIQQYQNNIIFLILGLILLLVSVIFIFLNHKNKQKITRAKLEKKAIAANLKGQENERYKIAEELHDDIGSKLAGASNILKNLVDDFPEINILKNVEKEVTQSYKEIRLTSHRMAHYSKMNKDIIEGVQEFIDEYNLFSKAEINFIYKGKQEPKINDKIKLAVYRSVQELIINAVKHSQATQITTFIEIDNTNLQIKVIDNGIGFNKDAKKGIGLANIEERIKFLNGKLVINSKNGTEIFINIPIS